MLSDVSEIFRKMYIELNELDPACSLTAPRLAWQAALKRTKSKIRSFNWHRHVINGVEKGIRGGICHAICRYVNNKYMANFDKDKESSYLKYWNLIKIKNHHILSTGMEINYTDGQCHKRYL